VYYGKNHTIGFDDLITLKQKKVWP